MARILITGASGQLGRALQLAFGGDDLAPLARDDLDITDAGAVLQAVAGFRPDVVIHPAAWTDTAGCERDPERARLVNGEAAGFVAVACRESGATLVHISSNEVFDGEKGSPYDEGDATNPVNEYGRSKLLGEQNVAGALPEHYIVRTSWLYGPGRVSFPEKILDRARSGAKLQGVTDEIASPTRTLDLASAIARLIETRQYGVYHLVNEGECSRLEWAQEVLRLAGVEVPIEPVTQASFDSPFCKPVLSTLDNERAAALGVRLRPWREALVDHMAGTHSRSAA